jgi:hypothetical protein
MFQNRDIPYNQTKGTLTLFLFALTIQNMIHALHSSSLAPHSGGFFRPDHDPPQNTDLAFVVLTLFDS